MFEQMTWKKWLKQSFRALSGRGPRKSRRLGPSSKPQVQFLEDRVTPAEVNAALGATITPESYAATEQVDLSLKNKGLAVTDSSGSAGVVTVSLTVTEGVLTVAAGDSGATVNGSGASSVTIVGTVPQINDLFNSNATSAVNYNDNTDTPSASATLTLQIRDNGETSTPPSGEDSAIIGITAENDAPVVVAPASYSGTANAAIVMSGITFSDVDGLGGNELAFFAAVSGTFTAANSGGVSVTGSGANNLTLMGTPADLTTFIANGQLTYASAASQDITVSIDDLGHTGTKGQKTGSATVSVNVTPTNSPATITGDTTGDVTEAGGVDNGAPTHTGDLNSTDTDNPSDVWTVTPAGTASIGGFGAFAVATDGIWTYTLDNTNAAVQALDDTATLTDTFNAATIDGTIQVVTITIHGQNDAPVNTVPGAQTAASGTSLVFNIGNSNAITIADVDAKAADVSVTLAALHGALTLGSTSGLTSQSGDGTGTVHLSGPITAVNDALNNLAYLAGSAFSGADTLTVTTIDNGALQDQDQVAITTKPTVTSSTANLAADQTTLVINGSGFDAVTPENNVVIFSGGLTGVVTSATGTQLTVGNLSGSGLVAGPLSASVTVHGFSSGAATPVAKVTPVVTASTSPLAGNVTSIVINGFGFDPTLANNSVTFGGAAAGSATITSATPTSLTVALPANLVEGPLTAAVTTNTIDSGDPVQVATIEVVDLAVTNASSAGPVHAGDTITYNISIKNNSANTAAQKIKLSDVLPAGTTFVSFTAPAGWTSSTPNVGAAGTITSTFNSLAAGATADFTLVVRVNPNVAAGPLANTATATSDNFDSNASNDAKVASTTVDTRADLQVSIAGPANAVPSNDVTYTITITNAGPSDAQTVTLHDAVPTGATFVSASQTAGPTFTLNAPTAGSATGTIDASIATLAAGASATFSFVFHTSANGTITNQAAAATATTDVDSSNDSGTQITSVSPDIVIDGAAGDDTILISTSAGNGSITYALNGGAPVTLSGVTSFTFNGKDGDDTITVNLPATGAIIPGDIAVDGGLGANKLVVDANGQPTQFAIGGIKGTQQNVKYVNVQSTNVNNAPSTSAFAGPNTADRATALAGLDEKQRFVQVLYLDVLGRAGDATELDFWLGVLNTSGQGTVAKGIERSGEARNRLVQTWYQIYLGRAGDASETQGWADLLKNGQTEEAVLSQILGGSEFSGRAKTLVATGTDQERYVTALYQVLLARVPDASEVASWVDSGHSNVAIARSMLQSREFRTNQIEAYYVVLLHRPAETEGRTFWIDSGFDLAKARVGFHSSPEFFIAG